MVNKYVRQLESALNDAQVRFHAAETRLGELEQERNEARSIYMEMSRRLSSDEVVEVAAEAYENYRGQTVNTTTGRRRIKMAAALAAVSTVLSETKAI